jgi:hypothetical protein
MSWRKVCIKSHAKPQRRKDKTTNAREWERRMHANKDRTANGSVERCLACEAVRRSRPSRVAARYL